MLWLQDSRIVNIFLFLCDSRKLVPASLACPRMMQPHSVCFLYHESPFQILLSTAVHSSGTYWGCRLELHQLIDHSRFSDRYRQLWSIWCLINRLSTLNLIKIKRCPPMGCEEGRPVVNFCADLILEAPLQAAHKIYTSVVQKTTHPLRGFWKRCFSKFKSLCTFIRYSVTPFICPRCCSVVQLRSTLAK